MFAGLIEPSGIILGALLIHLHISEYIHVTYSKITITWASFLCCWPLPEVQARAPKPAPNPEPSAHKKLTKSEQQQLIVFLKQVNAGEYKIPDGKKYDFILKIST